MTRNTLLAASFLIGSALLFSVSAQADIIKTTSSYDSPSGYDFSTTTPTSDPVTIGTYIFTIPSGASVTGITISGYFGNGDGTTTALSDYYLGFGGDETAVKVAGCDSASANCYSGQEGPYAWSATLTTAQISALSSALTAGSIDFTYTWGNSPAVQDFFSQTGYDSQFVYAGATSIDISYSPEPATILFGITGLTAIAVLRRIRNA